MDRNISANFSLNSYKLNIVAEIGGSVSGSGFYDYGTWLPIVASPSKGYIFGNWTGGQFLDFNDSSTTVYITDEHNITGTFEPKPYELILNSGTGGSVVGSGNYPFGSSVTISAYPQPGYSFSHWIGSGTLNPLDPSTDVVMLQQRSLFAIFTLNEISTTLGAIALDNNWFYTWLGNIFQTSNNWIYHSELGWMYLHNANSGIWLWQENLGWMWSQKDIFSQHFLWLKNSANWIYLNSENEDKTKIYDYQSSTWMDWPD